MCCETWTHVLIVNIPESVCSVNVCTHSAFAKSHIFTVVSPLVVANFVPLEEEMRLKIHNIRNYHDGGMRLHEEDKSIMI